MWSVFKNIQKVKFQYNEQTNIKRLLKKIISSTGKLEIKELQLPEIWNINRKYWQKSEGKQHLGEEKQNITIFSNLTAKI